MRKLLIAIKSSNTASAFQRLGDAKKCELRVGVGEWNFHHSFLKLEHQQALSSQIIQCLSNVALFVSFRDPVRGFVSEDVAKAAGFRRENSLGGDASALSPEANCLVVNRDSDLPQPQFS